jgi:hypothetical protein
VDCVYESPLATTKRLRGSVSGNSSAGSGKSSPDNKDLVERPAPGAPQRPAERRRGKNFDPLEIPRPDTIPVPSFLPEGDVVLDLPESRERRMWELRLMHNFTDMLARQRVTATQPRPSFLYTQQMVSAGFESDGALYAVFSHSALNMWTLETDPAVRNRLDELRQTYLALALREQQASIADLNIETADSVCMTSLALLGQLFAQVQLVPTEPWEPPLEWMRIGKGTGAVFEVTKIFLEKLPDSRWQRFVSAIPNFDTDQIFTPEHNGHLLWLIETPEGCEDRELENKVAKNVYKRILGYVGWVQKAVERGESDYAIMRRMGALTIWISDLFAEYAAQRRPRAMVILAWFFANGIGIDHMWNLNGAAKRQVVGIYRALPEEWRGKVAPLIEKHNLDVS